MTARKRPAKRKVQSVWVVEWMLEPLRVQTTIAHRTLESARAECENLNSMDCTEMYRVAEYRRVERKRR